ncbi:hypothetical protein COU60_01430 [Candidatus Pacearchaeota archaeon CG10_big_fil_rev_8_21_14_0_10_34_76]|nr:MAG: hypothetical protein COU60_01430 [Candidatus Pacearchaeota archaeon CG10_big_fil_rev_8_21_14_0_10_34_76]
MKGIFVILDGVADEGCQALGMKTPLDAAKTPNLDYLAKKSKLDYCYSVKEGIAPESSNAVVSLLGYDPNLAPRGPLEAQGYGIKLTRGDLALRVNFASVDSLDGIVLDSRAGRTLTTREAKLLARAINQKVKLPFKFDFYSTSQHRGVVVFRGGFSDNISNANPFYSNGNAMRVHNPKFVFSKPLDDEEDSKLAADLVNMFIRKSHEVLDKHPINITRAKKGLYAANVLICREAGNEPVRFKKLRGKWMALGYMPLERGIAKAAGMDVFRFSYPKFKGMDAYSHLHAGLRKAIKQSVKMIRKNRKKYDYFYVHIKETDIPGHDNKPLDKVKMIEVLDKQLFSFLRGFVVKNNCKLVVTADHTTSCRLKAHTDKPVPVMFYASGNGKEKEQRFREEDGLKGKKIMGRKLLEKTLFAKL